MSAHDSGQYLEVSEAWVESVRKRLKALNWSQRKLAQEIGVDAATVTNVLKRTYPTSRHVRPICRVLHLPEPVANIRDRHDARWIELGRRMRELDADEFERLLEEQEALLGARLDDRDRQK